MACESQMNFRRIRKLTIGRTHLSNDLGEELQDRGGELRKVFDEAVALLVVQEQLQLRLLVTILEVVKNSHKELCYKPSKHASK